MLVVDTGVLIAAADTSDRVHLECAKPVSDRAGRSAPLGSDRVEANTVPTDSSTGRVPFDVFVERVPADVRKPASLVLRDRFECGSGVFGDA